MLAIHYLRMSTYLPNDHRPPQCRLDRGFRGLGRDLSSPTYSSLLSPNQHENAKHRLRPLSTPPPLLCFRPTSPPLLLSRFKELPRREPPLMFAAPLSAGDRTRSPPRTSRSLSRNSSSYTRVRSPQRRPLPRGTGVTTASMAYRCVAGASSLRSGRGPKGWGGICPALGRYGVSSRAGGGRLGGGDGEWWEGEGAWRMDEPESPARSASA